jgi:hypothetical protein
MKQMDCKYCEHGKSFHSHKGCKICLEIYWDNYKEYMAQWEYGIDYISPIHEFKLDNLKYLEQIYESHVL